MESTGKTTLEMTPILSRTNSKFFFCSPMLLLYFIEEIILGYYAYLNIF